MFQIRRQSPIPLIEQVRRELADRIQSGMLAPGSRLPSVRQLSETLQVSLVTVVKAYRLLEQDGLAVRIHGKGTFVQYPERIPQPGPASAEEGAFDWQVALVDYLPRAALWRQHTGAARPDLPYKMSTASLNPQLAAAALPADVMMHLHDSGLLHEYGPIEGLQVLRQSIVEYLGESGLAVHAEDILITNGVQQAIDIVARTFVGPGDVVAIEAPTYSGAIDVFRSRGAILVPVPLDDDGMRIDALMKQCDRTPPKVIYTMPTFHNPTGTVMSARRRAQLLDLAESCQSLIVEDDAFAECSFIGATPAPIRSLDRHGHVIYLKGFSKVLLPGCRVAAVIASGSVRNRLAAAKAVSDLGSPTITQALIHAALRQPGRKKYIREVSRAVERKRDIALDALSRFAPPDVRWTVPRGGFNIWLTLPGHVNTDQLLATALQQGVSFLPGSACHSNESVTHQLRLSFAYLEDDALREGVSRLCRLLAESLDNKPELRLPLV